MSEAKDYLDFLEQHRLMDDAQKYPLAVEYARSCEAEIARLRAALLHIEGAISLSHPSLFNQSLSVIARAALEGRE